VRVPDCFLALHRELFKSVDCEELLKGRFMQPQESPSFTAMVKRFNLVRKCHHPLTSWASYSCSHSYCRPCPRQTRRGSGYAGCC
jgi:hypothetical protein